MRIQKPREIAARVLQQREKAADYVENLLEAGLPSLSPADRSLCQELVYGVVRRQRTLDWLIARKAEGRVQKATLQILLRLGLYQMFWLHRVPDHAAVNETVELARQLGCGPQSGFINALLRGYAREREETRKLLDELKANQPGLGYSHPDWLCERWQKRRGADKLRHLLEWNNTPPETFARVNTLRTDAGKLLEQWRHEDVEYDFVQRDWLEENLVFELKSHPPLTSLPSFQKGLFYVQDPSTLLPVRELDPQPGETILDLCAAPGGKTTYIAQLMHNRGQLVAEDVDSFRLRLLRDNCARLGVSCVEMAAPGDEVPNLARPHSGLAHEPPLFGDSDRVRTPPHPPFGHPLPPSRGGRDGVRGAAGGFRGATGAQNSGSLPQGEGRSEGKHADPNPPSTLRPPRFDRVLVDAPCSNTGVMRRRVDLRWRVRPEEIDRLRSAQLELLHHGALQIKPAGVLVYSTCSLEPEENGEVVKEFLAGHSGFKLEAERELSPFADGVDGAYVAKFVKRWGEAGMVSSHS